MSYYSENRETILAKKKIYQSLKKDAISEYQATYYQLNKEKKKKKSHDFYVLHRTERIAEDIAYARERKATDPLYKMSHNIRSLLAGVLKFKGFSKKSKTAKLLGCTDKEFYNHIEFQFIDGMTWDNYGIYWTYDHICPCAQAQDEEELIKLQHYSNLRPYIENLKKSDNKTPEGEKLCLILLNRQWINRR